MRTKRNNPGHPMNLPGNISTLKKSIFLVLAGILITAASCKKSEDPNVNIQGNT